MFVLFSLYLLFFVGSSSALNNGLGRTPQMGKFKTHYQFESRVVRISRPWERFYLFLAYFILKDGTVGIIFTVISMKQLFDKQQMQLQVQVSQQPGISMVCCSIIIYIYKSLSFNCELQ
jgi:hypothetical protein